jgi:GAF domain-containing protein
MLRNGETDRSINVSRDAVRPFSERQIELLKTFADQAVISDQQCRTIQRNAGSARAAEGDLRPA